MPEKNAVPQKWIMRVLVVMCLLMGARLVFTEIAKANQTQEAQRLATDNLILEAERDGLVVEVAETSRSLTDLLSDTVLMSAAFARQGERLRAANVRSASLTNTVTTLRGRLETTGTVFESEPVDTPFVVTDLETAPDSIGAHFESDSTSLVADVMCRVSSASCTLDYGVIITGRLLHVVGPDGRLFVTAEMDQSDVEFSIPSFEWVPEKKPWSFWTKTGVTCAAGAVPGAAIGYLASKDLASTMQGALFGCAAAQLGRFVF